MTRFANRFRVSDKDLILDVGGTETNWALIEPRPKVVLVNVEPRENLPSQFSQVVADGCQLPFRTNSFELVFSNSVIEHVGDRERQKGFAEEIARVGRRFFVQTPSRTFPFEPHFLTPFIHF